MSKGGGSQTTTTTQQIDPAIMGLIQGNVSRSTGIADQPFQAYDPNNLVAPLSANQNSAIDMAGGIGNLGMPALSSAIGGAGSAIGGNIAGDISKYQNPYTDSVINASLADNERARQMAQVNDNQAATAAHAFGGSRQGVADALTNEAYDRNAGSLISNLRAQGFNTAAGLATNDANRSLQGSALLGQLAGQQQQFGQNQLGALLSTGALQQSPDQQLRQAQYDEFMRQLNYPYQGQSLINQSLGLLPQSGTTTQTGPKPDNTGSLLGGLGSIIGGAGLLFSDGRLKEDLVFTGYDNEGRAWYEYRYIWDEHGIRRRGVIAQEIIESDPEAVFVHEPSGYLMVDYNMLTRH